MFCMPYLTNERQKVSPTRTILSPHRSSSSGSGGCGGCIGFVTAPTFSLLSSWDTFSENIDDFSFTSSGLGEVLPTSLEKEKVVY